MHCSATADCAVKVKSKRNVDRTEARQMERPSAKDLMTCGSEGALEVHAAPHAE